MTFDVFVCCFFTDLGFTACIKNYFFADVQGLNPPLKICPQKLCVFTVFPFRFRVLVQQQAAWDPGGGGGQPLQDAAAVVQALPYVPGQLGGQLVSGQLGDRLYQVN